MPGPPTGPGAVGRWTPWTGWPRVQSEAMFVRYYLALPLPAGQVEQILVRAPCGWLAAIAATAQERGHGLLSELGVERPGARVGPVAGPGPGGFRLGDPVHLASMTSLPLAWEPAGLLAGLDAVLELGALGPARTQLAISARYQPPRPPPASQQTGSWPTGSPRPP